MSTEAEDTQVSQAATDDSKAAQTVAEESRNDEQQAKAVTAQQSTNEEVSQATSKPSDEGPPIVLVTGASGFLATHIVQQLLQQARFRVRGTVRDKNRKDKVKPLTELAADAKYPLELVEADLTKEDTWKDAVRGCSYVFHVASPFPNITKQPKNPEVVIRPAVDGALGVLKACAESGTVKRVVLTSSSLAMTGGVSGESGKIYTEEDWATEESCTGPYERSKFLAERAAWDFVDKLEEGKKFELVSVLPSTILGPFISASSGTTSASFIGDILGNKLPGLPSLALPIVDVRDAAAVHIAAMESPEAAGKRFTAHNKTMTYVEFAAIISREFKPQGYKVPTKPMKKFVLGVIGTFNKGAKFAAKNHNNEIQLSNDKIKSVLGIELRSEESTIIDQCYTLVDLGIIKKKPGYLGHPERRPKQEPKLDQAPAKPEDTLPTTEEPNASPKEDAKEGETGAVGIEVEKTQAEAEEQPLVKPEVEEPPAEPNTNKPAEEPKTDISPAEESKATEPTAEEPKAEELPAVGEPKAGEPPSVEDSKAEESPAEEAKAEEPKAEEPPAAEEPKAEDPPAVEAKEPPPAEEEPKAEEPPPAEEPQAEDSPAVEEPKAEEPPTVEEPKPEEPPVVEELQAEEPSTEETEAIEPVVEEPQPEEPAAEEPEAKDPPAEEPQPEEPAAEEPETKDPAAEEPQSEELPAEELQPEEPPAEELQPEEPPAEEPKTEEPDQPEETQPEEPPAEEPKTEEPDQPIEAEGPTTAEQPATEDSEETQPEELKNAIEDQPSPENTTEVPSEPSES